LSPPVEGTDAPVWLYERDSFTYNHERRLERADRKFLRSVVGYDLTQINK